MLDLLTQQTGRAKHRWRHAARWGRECLHHLGEGSGQAAGREDVNWLLCQEPAQGSTVAARPIKTPVNQLNARAIWTLF